MPEKLKSLRPSKAFTDALAEASDFLAIAQHGLPDAVMAELRKGTTIQDLVGATGWPVAIAAEFLRSIISENQEAISVSSQGGLTFYKLAEGH